MTRINRRQALLATAALVPATLMAHGGQYPNKPIRLVVPFSPGGAGDASARVIADKLGPRLGVQVNVDNKPGASGYIGSQLVASAPPDGYTLLLGFDGSLVVAPTVIKAPYDPVADFAPITKLNNSTLILVAHPSVKANTLHELIAISKSQPGGLHYGSAGAGQTAHLAGELLAMRSGLRLTHVPYKGGGQAVNDVLAGQIPLMFTAVATAAGFIKEGRLKGIVVASPRRAASLPDVPTVMESGVADFQVASWFGLLAPARTPKPVIKQLNQEVLAVLAQPDVRERYLRAGLEPAGNSPDEFSGQIRSEWARWAKVVKDGGIKVE